MVKIYYQFTPLATAILSQYQHAMNAALNLDLFDPLDYAALALLLVIWLGIGWRIEHASVKARPFR